MTRALRVVFRPLRRGGMAGQVLGGTLSLTHFGSGRSHAPFGAQVSARLTFKASAFASARKPERQERELGALVGTLNRRADGAAELVVSVADSAALLTPEAPGPDAPPPRCLRLELAEPSLRLPPGRSPQLLLRVPPDLLEGMRHLEVLSKLEVDGALEADFSVNDVLDVPLFPRPALTLQLVDDLNQPLPGIPVDFGQAPDFESRLTDARGRAIIDDLGLGAQNARITDATALREQLKARWGKIRPGRALRSDPGAGIETRFVGTSLDSVSFEDAALKTLAIVPRVTLVRIVGLLFDTDRSFLLPSALGDMAELREVSDEHPDSELLVVGHTDTSADPATNDPLSLERAESVIAFLRQDADTWLKRYDSGIAARHRWGSNEDQQMLLSLPGMLQRPTGEDPVSFFRRTRAVQEQGPVGSETRRSLIEEYMSQPEPILPRDMQLTPHGCGELFPLDAAGADVDPNPNSPERDPRDRRVELFFFDKEFGIQPAPPGKNSKQGSREYPEWRRRATLSRDIDLRLSDLVLRVRLQANDEDLPNEEFLLDVDGRRFAAAKTDANALVVQRLPIGAKLVELRIPRLDLRRSITLTPADEFPPVSTLLGVQTRLAQLGFLPEEPNGQLYQLTRDALRRFRSSRGLGTDSTLDDATRNALVQAYGS